MHDIQALRRVLEYAIESLRLLPEPKEQWPQELERRGNQRHFYRVEGIGRLSRRKGPKPITVEPDWPMIGLTLSRTGVSFLANYDFQLGDILTLTVPAGDGEVRNLTIRVVRCRRMGMKAHEVAGEFTELETTGPEAESA